MQLNDTKWLYLRYWGEKCSTREIAKGIGCSKPAVLNALRRGGIKIKSNSEGKKGKIPSTETLIKLSNARKGVSRSKEAREAISIGITKMWGVRGCRTPAQRKINDAIRIPICIALKGAKEGRHWETLVGYTLNELMSTLEEDFRDGMTWDNYGTVWHIDHMIPLARFKYNSPEDIEFKKAWSLGNLQPLLVGENLKKHTNFRFY